MDEIEIIDIHDKVAEAYYGKIGDKKFVRETRERIHWICSQVSGDKILDVGCSQGITAILLAREGAQVTGIDIDSDAIDDANSLLTKQTKEVTEKVDFISQDFMAFDVTEKYDTIIMSEVLEHLVRPAQFIEKACSALSENGKLIITVPFGINDYIDHKKTYYLNELKEIVQPCFEEFNFTILGRWIGVSTWNPRNLIKDYVPVTKNELTYLERSFFSLERGLVDEKIDLLNANNKHVKTEETYKRKLGDINEELKNKIIDNKKLEKNEEIYKRKLGECDERTKELILENKQFVKNEEIYKRKLGECDERTKELILENKQFVKNEEIYKRKLGESKEQLKELNIEFKQQLMRNQKLRESIEFGNKKITEVTKKIETLYTQQAEDANTVYELNSELKQFKRKASLINNELYHKKRKHKVLQALYRDVKKDSVNKQNELRGSLRYQLGEQLVNAIKSPYKLPIYPFTAFNIYRLGKRNKVGLSVNNVDALDIPKNEKKGGKKRFAQKKVESMPAPITEDKILTLLKSVDCEKKVQLTKNRICYVLHNSLPYASGGYATRSHGMLKGMVDNGYDVVALTRPGFPLDVKDTEIMECEPHIIDNISYQRIEEPKVTGRSLSSYMHNSVEALIIKLEEIRPEFIIAASSYRSAMPAAIAAKKLGIPFYYEVRGFWEITRISREPEFKKTSNFHKQVTMEAETAKSADHVFTLTRAMREELIRRGVEANQITLLPNSADIEQFNPQPKSLTLLQKLNIPQDTIVIGYIGSFVHYEGLEDLALACAKLKHQGVHFRLMIVGSENVSKNEKGVIATNIANIAEENSFSDWLIMPGRVPHEEVENYYSIIDIAPFPRKPLPVTEMVSPMKPLEAMAMEKAVVVSSVDALNEMIVDEHTGLVFEKGNVDSLSGALTKLVKDANLRLQLSKAGRKHVINERNWKKTTARLKKVLAGK